MLRVNRVINRARASISNCQYLLSHDPNISPSPPQHFASKSSIRFFDVYKLASKEKIEKERARLGGYGYLLEPLWWVGMLTMIIGEISNFVAYIYAPAVLVMPLGALSVIVSACFSTFHVKGETAENGNVGMPFVHSRFDNHCAACSRGAFY